MAEKVIKQGMLMIEVSTSRAVVVRLPNREVCTRHTLKSHNGDRQSMIDAAIDDLVELNGEEFDN